MEVQQALNEYEKYFGVNYFFYIGHEKTGKAQKEPEYDQGKLY
ncbi:MAG: hypothetical protein ACLUGO_13065 [Mediterraneibacter faecis]